MGDAKSGVGASTLTREGAPPSEDLRDRVNRNRYAQRRRHVAQRVEPGPALRGNHHLVARLQLQLIEGAACCDRPPQRIALPYRLTVAGDLRPGRLDRVPVRRTPTPGPPSNHPAPRLLDGDEQAVTDAEVTLLEPPHHVAGLGTHPFRGELPQLAGLRQLA